MFVWEVIKFIVKFGDNCYFLTLNLVESGQKSIFQDLFMCASIKF